MSEDEGGEGRKGGRQTIPPLIIAAQNSCLCEFDCDGNLIRKEGTNFN
jgi:hypothetical protein